MTPLVVGLGLAKTFGRPRTWWQAALRRPLPPALPAVDGVDLSIERGRTFGLVGESGSGKTTVGRMMVGLAEPSAGEVRLGGEVLAPSHRGRVQMIFQDPHASMNPRWTVERIVAEPLRALQRRGTRGPGAVDVAGLLESVGLTAADRHRHPHQFSGGQRQRIAIARALSTSPDFIVCDEPTSALDVSVQAQVLNLMKDLQAAQGMAYLFISHNLAVVRQVSDDVGVMYLGRLVETGPAAGLFSAPRHPYTRQLLDAVPDPARGRHRAPVAALGRDGEGPDPVLPATGCAFQPRCPHARARCLAERPLLLNAAGEGRAVACHAVEEGRL